MNTNKIGGDEVCALIQSETCSAPGETNGASPLLELIEYVNEHFWWRLSGGNKNKEHIVRDSEVEQLQRLSQAARECLIRNQSQQFISPSIPWTPFSERMPTESDLIPSDNGMTMRYLQCTPGEGIYDWIVIPTQIDVAKRGFTHWRIITIPQDLPQPIKPDVEKAFEEFWRTESRMYPDNPVIRTAAFHAWKACAES